MVVDSIALKDPTMQAAINMVLAVTIAASELVAPMRLAIRVEAAIDMGKEIW